MNIRALDLKEPSKLLDDYINHYERVSSFFVYDYHADTAYKERLAHLKERKYAREELVQYLLGFNQKYHPHQKVLDNIEKLRNEEAVVVVAGQQAGLLTGPAYTIHKCLSILKFAEKKEKELGVPVIPVFWVAGEDHDYEEVNHVHLLDAGRTRKHKLKISGAGVNSVSLLPLDREKLVQWVKLAFQAYGETKHTDALLEDVIAKANASTTMVDFFSAIIHEYFGTYGLVLMDSGDPNLRQLESEHFVKMIENNVAIGESVTNQLNELKKQGYSVALDQKPLNANLFYHENGERALLERSSEGTFINTARGIELTKTEILEIAMQNPEKLSNNVVTRPLMQESLLPTLAFIGGPGEVAYWSALKGAFEVMGMLMPPILPRIRITMVDQKTKKWLNEKELGIDDALINDWDKIKEDWLKNQHEWDVEAIFTKVSSYVGEAVQPLYQLASEVNPVLEPLTLKNKRYLDEQLEFMRKAIERELKLRYDVELSKFDRVKAALAPGGNPQERTWTIYYFLNYWGANLITRLMEMDSYSFDGAPLIVEL
jgi:bacillithiol synthase